MSKPKLINLEKVRAKRTLECLAAARDEAKATQATGAAVVLYRGAGEGFDIFRFNMTGPELVDALVRYTKETF